MFLAKHALNRFPRAPLPITSRIMAQTQVSKFPDFSHRHQSTQEPQVITNHEHHHDKLWKYERYLSVGLLGILPAAALFPSPLMDHAVALTLVIHVHWGFEAIVVDYVRPSIFGKTIPKISVALVYVLSSLALGGLFLFNHTDVGITQATRMLAKI